MNQNEINPVLTVKTTKNSKGNKNRTAVMAMMSNPTTLDIMNQVRAEIGNMTDICGQSNRTNGQFKYNPSLLSGTNLAQVQSVAELLNIAAFVFRKETDYNEAGLRMGFTTTPVFKWCGYTAKDWEYDIKKYITILQNNGKLAKLQNVEKGLTDLLSQGDKLNMLAAQLAEILKG
jgi:hypothetical protein